MRLISIEKLIELQKRPENIRNICILAHVDHGKTTLADSLLAANGIISARMVGQLRYLDSRPDEQERGITMKSSAVSIFFKKNEDEFLLNLLDSPGHIDFGGEVSTAVRLSDGALILVDVVEGMCSQTQALIRQAWKEEIRPILILNKIDRLITDLKLTPVEAYCRNSKALTFERLQYRQLQFVLEQVNAIAGDLYVTKTIEAMEMQENSDELTELELEENNVYFQPEAGNVIFASSLDGWGFTIADFARIYAERTGMKSAVLQQTLWGDFYLDSKAKRIFKGAHNKSKSPLFVSMILQQIWAVYDAIVMSKDKEKAEKIVKSLNLTIAARDLRNPDSKIHVQAVMSQWIPMAKTVLNAICVKLPSPTQMSERKVESLLSGEAKKFENFPTRIKTLKTPIVRCDQSESAPVIVYVSKLLNVDSTQLSKFRHRPPFSEEEIQIRRMKMNGKKEVEFVENGHVHEFDADSPIADDRIFVGFARIYSGTLKVGQEIFVLPADFDPEKAAENSEYANSIPKIVIKDLYLMMGRELESIPAAPAGAIVGIAGLESFIAKSGTLSSTLDCPAFFRQRFYTEPIIRVAVEPVDLKDMGKLAEGLKLLHRSDPSAKTYVQDTGEHVLVTAGEVHLQRCLDDLKQRFAKVDLNVSAPIVPFLETIVAPPKLDMVNETISSDSVASGSKSIDISTANKLCLFRLRAAPIPDGVVELLQENESLLKLTDDRHTVPADLQATWNEFRDRLQAKFAAESDTGDFPASIVDRIWAFGPRKARPNLLINAIESYERPSLFASQIAASKNQMRDYDQSVVHGFHLRCQAGPLCEEPLRGVAIFVEAWEFGTAADDATATDAYGPISGQIIATMKEGCKQAFQAQPQRLMMAMYSCEIQATADVLGKVYSVLNKRGGRVLGEQLKEGLQVFEIDAVLPVIESFGFAEELRKKASGLASPQLVFSHWEVLDIDPFWQPRTEEELSHFGEKSDSENLARKYMNAVRKRKGLAVDEKIVESATKQRTLTKMK